jgi:hypothetical protein
MSQRGKRSDLRGFDLRFGYVAAEKADQKPHNKRVKETSEVFTTLLHDHLNAYSAGTCKSRGMKDGKALARQPGL